MFEPNVLRTVLACAFVLLARLVVAEQVTVRYAEGLGHGFLSLRTLDGVLLADGDLFQVARASRVTSRLVFRFKDGSVYEEITVYLQRQHFRLVSDHLVRKGPAFRQPLEMSINAITGEVTVQYADEHGEQKVASERLELPLDLANGLIPILLKNVRPDAAPKAVSLVVATPKPRLVKLAISQLGENTFSTAGTSRKATHYVLTAHIGGISGLLAPLLGKQPPDSHVWIAGGEAPVFVKAEQPLFLGGPPWRIEVVSPVWPDQADAK